MDVSPPARRLGHDPHSYPSASPALLLHHIHPRTRPHHPIHPFPHQFPPPRPPATPPHIKPNSSFMLSPSSLHRLPSLSRAVHSSLSPDITWNHILNSSLQSSLSTHSSPLVSSSPRSSPLQQILDQAHYLRYPQYTHRNPSRTGHVRESVSVTLMERCSANMVSRPGATWNSASDQRGPLNALMDCFHQLICWFVFNGSCSFLDFLFLL